MERNDVIFIGIPFLLGTIVISLYPCIYLQFHSEFILTFINV